MKSLPSYVKKAPEKLQRGWLQVFNTAFEKYGEKRAFVIANAWLKEKLSKKSFVKRSAVKFEMVNDKSFIKRSSDGEDYITFVLNSVEQHVDGKSFSEPMLKKWAEYINNNPDIVGDVDHLFYDKVLSSTLSDEQIRRVLKSKRGIAKTVKAVYEKGKLWVKAAIDKRYRKIIEKAKGVSAEALCTWDNNIAVDGELLGFTFNVNTNPADSYAGVYA